MGSAGRLQTTKKDRELAGVAPGSHGVSLISKGPAFSLGVKPVAKEPETIPGAGHYELPSKLIESPGKSIAKRYPEKDIQGHLGNGPAAYNPSGKKNNDFKFSIGGARCLDPVQNEKAKLPGPGNYNMPDIKRGQQANFGVGVRSSLDAEARKMNLPGPGQYKHHDKRMKGLEFTMGHAVNNKVGPQVPGPGQYKVK
jgi:hypothetical protein